MKIKGKSSDKEFRELIKTLSENPKWEIFCHSSGYNETEHEEEDTIFMIGAYLKND